MDAVKYFEEKRRMVDSIGGDNGNCLTAICKDCPISQYNNSKNIGCSSMENMFPEEAVAIIEKWSQEHPLKTMLSDFLEKYPKASLEKDGTPSFCPEDLGYCEEVYCDMNSLDCTKCWNRPLEEGEQ